MSSTVSRIWASRTIVASLVVAFVAAGLLALARPVPAAAPTAPWFSPNVIVNAPPAYTGYQPSLGIDGEGVLYLAFGGWGGSTTQADVFFTKSMDGGRTWSAPFKVNNDIGGAIQTEPSLFIDHNSVIYIAWTDTRNGNQDVFFSKSADRGLLGPLCVRGVDRPAERRAGTGHLLLQIHGFRRHVVPELLPERRRGEPGPERRGPRGRQPRHRVCGVGRQPGHEHGSGHLCNPLEQRRRLLRRERPGERRRRHGVPGIPEPRGERGPGPRGVGGRADPWIDVAGRVQRLL